jgi:DNA-binding beta-propeller fold protein YncE
MRLCSLSTHRRIRSAAGMAIASVATLVILAGGASAAAAGKGWAWRGFGFPSPWVAPYARFDGIFGQFGFPALGSHAIGGATALTVPVGAAPFAVAVDQATHTAYVGNTIGNTIDGEMTVSVVNTATCNAAVATSCGQVPPVVTVGPAVGPGIVDAAVDEKTDTIYVVNLGTNTVSVIDGATCNASVTTGCDQTPETVTVSGNPDESPDGVAVDEATDTVYVANVNLGPTPVDGTVSVIDGATCNATVTAGCGQTPATVTVGVSPAVPAVNQATDTVYVPNAGDGTISVIDGSTCSATVTTGCGNTPAHLSTGGVPNAAAVDQATDTVYVAVPADVGFGSVAVINGATCDATVASGCGQTPVSVPAGVNADDLVVDPDTQSVFVVNQNDSTVSIIDGAICNAHDTAGCAQRPPVVATGYYPGYLDVDIASDTVYVANYSENTVSVLNGASCTLTDQRACRHDAPTTTAGNHPQGSAVDNATDTIYVANQNDGDVSVIDGRACNAALAIGCGRGWPTVAAGAGAQAVAVDQQTDTVYVANEGANTVSVINGATCNAHISSGCSQKPATVTVGAQPVGLDVDEATDTIYVANADFNPGGPGTVSVIDGATCNATVRSGCGLTPPAVAAGNGPSDVAVDQTTDTVYVTNQGANPGVGLGDVAVIDGATCNAQVTSGCGQSPYTITVGTNPWGLAVNATTDTVYVANQGTGVGTGGISVIDGATCNAIRQSGCGQTPNTLGVDTAPSEITVDPPSDTVYATSAIDSDTDVFNGSRCNGNITSGCAQTPASVPMGGYPGNPVVDETNGTVYVPDNEDGEVSYFSAGF